MKKRYTHYAYAIALAVAAAVLLAGCGAGQEEGSAETPASSADAAQADVVTTASIVDTPDGFLDAAGPDGTWIIATLNDLTIDQEVVVAGDFTRNDELYRKLALYAQDENRTVTDRYTVSAPGLVVRSPNTRIQGGTFRGNLYVEAEKFHLVDATVDGDVTFANAALQESFSLDDTSEVTGSVGVDE